MSLTAKERGDLDRKPLITESEIAHVIDAFNHGQISLMKRGPSRCGCGAECTIQFVGHRVETHEWEYACPKCKEVSYGS